MPILVCDKIKYVYSLGTPFETIAIENIDFELNQGEIVGIIGHTGSGKSTFIQHLNGLLKPSQGTMFFDGLDIWSKENKKNIRNVRFSIGLCFQYPEYQIFEDDVYNEIAYGPKQMGLSNEEIKSRVLESIKFVGINKNMLNKSPFDLSGGQKRRVAIASIIAMKPQVLILDEPCAGLDPNGRKAILELIKTYQNTTQSSVIFISHSMDDVSEICSRVIVFNDGKICMDGTCEEVFSKYDELRSIGLDVPKVTEIFNKLKNKGIECKTNIYNMDDAIKELNRLYDIKEDIAK